MKTIKMLFAVMAVMGMISCTTELNDPVVDSSINNVLATKYNAQLLEESSALLSNLPELTLKEADAILSALRNHVDDSEELDVRYAELGDMQKWQVVMTRTISKKYSFTIQLNLTSYEDGSLFYNGYTNSCTLDEMQWHVGGFSFSSSYDSNRFKFDSKSYLYLKVEGDEQPLYYQVPVSITGQYNPNNHEASYTYSL